MWGIDQLFAAQAYLRRARSGSGAKPSPCGRASRPRCSSKLAGRRPMPWSPTPWWEASSSPVLGCGPSISRSRSCFKSGWLTASWVRIPYTLYPPNLELLRFLVGTVCRQGLVTWLAMQTNQFCRKY